MNFGCRPATNVTTTEMRDRVAREARIYLRDGTLRKWFEFLVAQYFDAVILRFDLFLYNLCTSYRFAVELGCRVPVHRVSAGTFDYP